MEYQYPQYIYIYICVCVRHEISWNIPLGKRVIPYWWNIMERIIPRLVVVVTLVITSPLYKWAIPCLDGL